MKKLQLVDNASEWWRWFSMRAQGGAIAILGGWGILPEKWQDAIPVWLIIVLACIVLVLGMIGRLVKQAPPPAPPADPAPPGDPS